MRKVIWESVKVTAIIAITWVVGDNIYRYSTGRPFGVGMDLLVVTTAAFCVRCFKESIKAGHSA